LTGTNGGSRSRDIKIWKDCDPADHDFCPLKTDEFDAVAAALAGTV
jgi:hypothetical protein